MIWGNVKCNKKKRKKKNNALSIVVGISMYTRTYPRENAFLNSVSSSFLICRQWRIYSWAIKEEPPTILKNRNKKNISPHTSCPRSWCNLQFQLYLFITSPRLKQAPGYLTVKNRKIHIYIYILSGKKWGLTTSTITVDLRETDFSSFTHVILHSNKKSEYANERHFKEFVVHTEVGVKMLTLRSCQEADEGKPDTRTVWWMETTKLEMSPKKKKLEC